MAFFIIKFIIKFATVYKARDRETGIIVAVKKVNSKFLVNTKLTNVINHLFSKDQIR